MGLAIQQKKLILKAIDDMDRYSLDRILASPEKFLEWLKLTSYSSYLKLKDNQAFELLFKFYLQN
jgi:hypothetical protein